MIATISSNVCAFFFYMLGKPQWDFMCGIMENALYGGRVDNMYDLRILHSYLAQFFNDSVICGQQGGASGRFGMTGSGLPIGNIPVSSRPQVCGEYEHVLYRPVHTAH